MSFAVVLFIMLIPVGLIISLIITSTQKANEEKQIRKEQLRRIKARKKH